MKTELENEIDAIVLISGGLDSSVQLAKLAEEGKKLYGLSFDYGQRHRLELNSAANICRRYQVPHQIIKLPPHTFAGSALTTEREIAKGRTTNSIVNGKIPSTYVPARNTIFLSFALGIAEQLGASEIYYLPNMGDRKIYPDCTPEYVKAFQKLINEATKQSVQGNAPKLRSPLIDMDKKEIVELGKDLGLPFEITLSCYDPTSRKLHCGQCDACILRKDGFKRAKIADPTVYQA